MKMDEFINNIIPLFQSMLTVSLDLEGYVETQVVEKSVMKTIFKWYKY